MARSLEENQNIDRKNIEQVRGKVLDDENLK